MIGLNIPLSPTLEEVGGPEDSSAERATNAIGKNDAIRTNKRKPDTNFVFLFKYLNLFDLFHLSCRLLT